MSTQADITVEIAEAIEAGQRMIVPGYFDRQYSRKEIFQGFRSMADTLRAAGYEKVGSMWKKG